MHVLITGASRGIGFETARKFASSIHPDLRLSICARHAQRLNDAADLIAKTTPEINIFASPCDISSESDVTTFVRQAVERFGPVDLLINNAGFGTFKAVEQMTSGEFDAVITTNLRGVFLMTRAVVPSMMERKSGTIVTVSSLAGRNGFEGGAAYCASKFGVRGLMQSLFLEVREYNIRVLTIFPGSVDTAFFDNVKSSKSVKPLNALEPQDIAEAVYLTVQLPSHATISELDIRPTNPKYYS
ncbi:MAG TPA: SDR family NAD(P)-dependent oxidoreductase [Candidatus Kapabacteria bacterium]|jgi:NADP-dependent 3-hydroxy acid dehydrogenase YdfG|nr:SDR family NAD(P)-dependent oxidoreductase [Candidatus Kapabacteria bacterium]